MAYIRTHETAARRKGKPVKRYVVCWREPVRDAFGLPVPLDADRPNGPKQLRSRQESYPTREAAEVRRDELNAAKHTGTTGTLADQKKAGDLPFGHYAQAWLESLRVRVANGKLKQGTYEETERLLHRYILDRFGGKAIGAISAKDCEDYLSALVHQPSRQGSPGAKLSPGTVTHGWNTLRGVMRYALRHDAIPSDPTTRVDFTTKRTVGDRTAFEHSPLSAKQIEALRSAIAGEIEAELPGYPVYGLMVEFLAYTGLRASENTGLEVRDLVFSRRQCTVQIRRTKSRRDGEWVTGTPKSARSRRSVPLPPWLAEKLRDYLANDHPRADEPTAPLWPSRKNGGGYRPKGGRYAVPLDWSQPLAMGTFYDTIMKPALEAVGLPASRPATNTKDGKPVPAVQGVRVHDLRHSFAVMHLMAGTHFMQVSKWLGHSTFTLTLNTYGDWIPEEDADTINHLPTPPSLGGVTETGAKVVRLFG